MYTFFVGFPSPERRKIGNILDSIFIEYGSEILLFEGLGVILTFFEMTLEFDRSVLEKLHEASFVVCMYAHAQTWVCISFRQN